MATNLKFAYPDIPFNAETITSSETYDSDYPVENLVSGTRAKYAKLAAKYAGQHEIEFDLGSGNVATANYIALISVKLLIMSGATAFTLLANNGGADATIVDIDLTTITLTGGHDRDYIETFAETSEYRYWIARFTSVDASYRTLSKLYFGKLFDLGRDPLMQSSARTSYHQDKAMHERKELSLSYSGITSAKRQDFEEKILQYKDINEVLLHTTSYELPFLNTDLLSAKINAGSFSVKNVVQHDLSLDIEETY
jgi:hypothetical protein